MKEAENVVGTGMSAMSETTSEAGHSEMEDDSELTDQVGYLNFF